MSMSDVERARAGYAAFARADMDELGEWFDPSIEWVDPPELPGGRSYRGRERVLDYLASIRRVWERFDVEVQSIEQSDEGVVVDIRIRARARASGAEVEDRVRHRVAIENGRALRIAVQQH
jgi:ketosteroid isomerase-like protein